MPRILLGIILITLVGCTTLDYSKLAYHQCMLDCHKELLGDNKKDWNAWCYRSIPDGLTCQSGLSDKQYCLKKCGD